VYVAMELWSYMEGPNQITITTTHQKKNKNNINQKLVVCKTAKQNFELYALHNFFAGLQTTVLSLRNTRVFSIMKKELNLAQRITCITRVTLG
jgi:hypothetical protein